MFKNKYFFLYMQCSIYQLLLLASQLYFKYTNPANGILDFCWSNSSGPSYSAKENTQHTLSKS